jgi:hypothetical protein
MKRVVLACASIWLASALPAGASHVTLTEQIGGPWISDGIPDGSLCPMGSSLVGIVGGIRDVAANPTVAVASAVCTGGADSPMGEWPGTPGATYCPPGEVVVGMVGRQGHFIDQIAVRCRPAAGGATTTAAPMGGPGGSPVGPYDCPAGKVAVGFTGQVVDWNPDHIRYLHLVCV